jgi:hypothetical protein
MWCVLQKSTKAFQLPAQSKVERGNMHSIRKGYPLESLLLANDLAISFLRNLKSFL